MKPLHPPNASNPVLYATPRQAQESALSKGRRPADTAIPDEGQIGVGKGQIAQYRRAAEMARINAAALAATLPNQPSLPILSREDVQAIASGEMDMPAWEGLPSRSSINELQNRLAHFQASAEHIDGQADHLDYHLDRTQT